MIRFVVSATSFAFLLLALLPLDCALLVQERYEFTRDSHATLADIIDPEMSDVPTFDNNGSNFDVMAQLFRESNVLELLSGNTDSGMTLLIPNDLAVNATAGDLSLALSISTPVTEEDAYYTIKTFIKRFEETDTVLSTILLFHILKEEKTFTELTEEATFVTMTSEDLERRGLTLIPAQTPVGIVSSFPPATLLPGPAFSIEASNGYLFVIDRVMFPRLSQFTLSDPAEVTDPGPYPIQTADGATVPPSSALPASTLVPSFVTVPSASSSTEPEAPSAGAPTTSSILPSSSPSVSAESDSNPECFPSSAFVHLEDGRDIRLSQLNAGHVIRTSESEASMVYLFTHKKHTGIYDFVRIVSDADHVIVLTKGHYLYANGKLKAADSINIGDTLRTLDGPSRVKSISTTRDYGLFAPHTMHGDLVVNRIVTSSYTTAMHPVIAHVVLWPIRAFVHIGVAKEPLGATLYNGVAGLFR